MTAEGKDIQIEEGNFTRLHNAILEALATARLSPLEFRIVLFVLRKTYGFQKKIDIISLSQFEQCGGSRPATSAAIQNLLRMNVLTRSAKGLSFEYGFNKYIETWSAEVFETRRPNQSENLNGKGSKADGTSKPDGTRGSKADGTKTSKADGTHKRKKESIKENPPEHQLMFGGLVKLCRVDPKLKGGQIGRTAKSLLKAGYLPSDLECFSQWWFDKDFRGLRGDPPTLPQVLEKISQAKQEYTRRFPPEQPKKTVLVENSDGTIMEVML